MEEWRDIPGYEGLYQASNKGNIRSVYYRNYRVLKPGKDHGGYLQVILYKNKIRRIGRVHRLVWSAFNGPIPEGMEINHIDECKTNNSLSNLNLLSRTQNMNWGTQKKRSAMARTNGKCSKPILQYTMNGVFLREWVSQQEITRQTGYHRGNISSCCNGKIKSSNGYVWRFKTA